jgi:hypothetical protein
MTFVTPLHEHFSPTRLAHVLAEMVRRGPPRIRAYLDVATGSWFALEGTHRLRAARALGLAPILISSSWPRRKSALEQARFAALTRGHEFEAVVVGNQQ